MIHRPRRNRRTQSIRDSLQETWVTPADLVYPIFVTESASDKTEIAAMPGQFRWGHDRVLEVIESAIKIGVKSFALFPVINDLNKDSTGAYSSNAQNPLIKATLSIKQNFKEATIYTDVALDPYSTDGHDGLVVNQEVVNDETLPFLAKMALTQANAGADFVAASDMMDGRIGFIRKTLDENGFKNTGILSYSAKYCSALYGPFREALDSAPRFGDKKTYQMNPGNRIEAKRELQLDADEGADILMIKPATFYLDIIREAKNNFTLPIAAYNVSGEYSMIKAASQKGWIDEARAVSECLVAIKRAGADLIFTYFALEAAARTL